MVLSDAILERLLGLHPKIIDLKLDRLWRLLARLGHPERALPPVIHVAGTNGKGSSIAYMRAMMEAAGLSVHVYTSPHLVRFHERIALGATGGGGPISEAELSALLEECETANGGEPITFFEITTAAAFLAFARHEADYLLLEVGLGGRLDATNVVDAPRACLITPVSLDHQQFLGDTLGEIAGEKAGILKPGVPCVVAPQADEALAAIEARAAEAGTPLLMSGQQWQAFEQHGRLVYQDDSTLLDLPLPDIAGRFQVENAGAAIAVVQSLGDPRIGDDHIETGLKQARWPARLQRLGPGPLTDLLPETCELWLDGGHNPAAARALTQSLADLGDRVARELVLVVGMLNSKAAGDYLKHFAGLAARVIAVTIPGEENAIPADELADVARQNGLDAVSAGSLEDAIRMAGLACREGRILIAGSLYLAGHVLSRHYGEATSSVSGTSARRGFSGTGRTG